MIPVNFLLNNVRIVFQCDLQHLNKIQNINIVYTIINDPNKEYTVESNVSENVFRSFLDYLRENTLPGIDSNNYYEYWQLSNEFCVLREYLNSNEFRDFANRINLLNLIQNPHSNRPMLESLISQRLDFYIENYPNDLQNIGITSLNNIFNHTNRILEDHDRAYHFILNSAANQGISFYSLLKTLDGNKFNSLDNLRDSLINIEEHIGFLPKNVQLLITNLDRKITDLEQTNSMLRTTISQKESELIENNTKINNLNENCQRMMYLQQKACQILGISYFDLAVSWNNGFQNANIFVQKLNQADVICKQTGKNINVIQHEIIDKMVVLIKELGSFTLKQ